MSLDQSAVVLETPETESVVCYYCGDAASRPFIQAQDDYTGKPGLFDFVECLTCGMVYQNPRITIGNIKAYYDDEYISHRKKSNWGLLTWFYKRGMSKHDREKQRLVDRYQTLNAESRVLDVGCAAATFLLHLREQHGADIEGVDFKDLRHLPGFDSFKFHCGLFYEQEFAEPFDLITMWHYLEHDYDPLRSLETARDLLTANGRLVIEVPCLDSFTFRLFRERWPGLQAPQHTVLFRRDSLLQCVEKAGLEVVDYLPYGAFPPYFYFFAGVAFKLLKGRGINLGRAIYPYFLGQLLMSPLLLLFKRKNLAMQTVICRRP